MTDVYRIHNGRIRSKFAALNITQDISDCLQIVIQWDYTDDAKRIYWIEIAGRFDQHYFTPLVYSDVYPTEQDALDDVEAFVRQALDGLADRLIAQFRGVHNDQS